MPDIKKIMTGPVRVGLIAALAAAALTVWSYWHSGSTPGQLYFAIGFPVVFGSFCGLLARRRFQAWLAGLIIGFAAGLASVVPLLLGERFDNEFYAGAATLVFFVVLGFFLGVAGEFVRLLHFVAHGGRVLDYPDLRDEPWKLPEPQARA